MQVEYWIVRRVDGSWTRWVEYPSLEAATTAFRNARYNRDIFAVAKISVEIVVR